MSLREAFEKVLGGRDLTSVEASEALLEIVTTEAPATLVAGLLVALRTKGESASEVAGFAEAMRAQAVRVEPKATGLVDTCGTGGDGKGTFNISTAAALVLAGAGLPVAKHGNRALSSRSGSADVLEVLGVPLDLDAARIARCIDEAGIGFLFAPALHPAMARVMPVRKELATRTIFNLLGPLTNPARPAYQLVGVGDAALVEVVAGAFAELSTERALVVHGAGGTDELTCAGENLVFRVEAGTITEDPIAPSDVGLPISPLEALVGGTPEENAATLRRTLDGESGPIRDAVLLNAGVTLHVAGAVGSVADGVKRAAEVVDSGAATERLARLVVAAS